jgi:uncharacterized metal-binding protein YceD (DUF177 family)
VSFLKQYSIQFASLKPGNYTFEFVLNDKFFENFDESEIKKGDVKIHVDLEKQARMLVFNFNIEGKVQLVCDRCLDEFEQAIKSEQRLIVKLGSEKKEETEEIIVIPEADHTILLAQFFYEYVHLALPVKKVHPTDKKGKSLCNKEVIKKLKEHEIKENSKPDKSDPRWDVLKKIKFN